MKHLLKIFILVLLSTLSSTSFASKNNLLCSLNLVREAQANERLIQLLNKFQIYSTSSLERSFEIMKRSFELGDVKRISDLLEKVQDKETLMSLLKVSELSQEKFTKYLDLASQASRRGKLEDFINKTELIITPEFREYFLRLNYSQFGEVFDLFSTQEMKKYESLLSMSLKISIDQSAPGASFEVLRVLKSLRNIEDLRLKKLNEAATYYKKEANDENIIYYLNDFGILRNDKLNKEQLSLKFAFIDDFDQNSYDESIKDALKLQTNRFFRLYSSKDSKEYLEKLLKQASKDEKEKFYKFFFESPYSKKINSEHELVEVLSEPRRRNISASQEIVYTLIFEAKWSIRRINTLFDTFDLLIDNDISRYIIRIFESDFSIKRKFWSEFILDLDLLGIQDRFRYLQKLKEMVTVSKTKTKYFEDLYSEKGVVGLRDAILSD